ncbi:MAG: SPOR domain-containing protein [Ignavibacteriae bacterium]|nr:SPOR domain-containing protein [Ignavibacteriota bacterium]
MNRDDLLKKCVDRRVAHETSVVAVSHLFYVYLLSALKKGQRVEVPKFGTFGTRMVGVKRARRMPYFEVENDLADKVNERYHNLKSTLIGTYTLTPASGKVEYTGKEPPYDSLVEEVGKEIVLDTYRDVTVEDFEREAAEAEVPPPSKERKLMPKINLKGEEMAPEPERYEPEPEPTMPVRPTLRDSSGTGGPSPIMQVLLALIILGAVTFALNYFGVIHLWGTRTPSPTETLPEVIQPPPVTEETGIPEPSVSETPAKTPTPTPTTPEPKVVPPTGTTPTTPEPKVVPPTGATPTPTPKPITPPVEKQKALPPSGIGNYTVQMSSWMKKSSAEEEVARLARAGYDAYVQEALVDGDPWYRVRVGRYGNRQDAQEAASKLKGLSESTIWVTTVGK